MTPLILDLFCGAGGAGVGYEDAGFEVFGVDERRQRNYPFEMHQGDALAFLAEADLSQFAAIHASPPCHAYLPLAQNGYPGKDLGFRDLIAETRIALKQSGKPWIIENIPGSPLRRPVTVCGGALGLKVQRHRKFESSEKLIGTGCEHPWEKTGERPVGVYGKPGGFGSRRGQQGFSMAEWVEAMQIDWMTSREITQAVPPAYTRFLGFQLIKTLK